MSALKDKVVIVTGGSRGIGRAICLKFASLGCSIAFSYNQNKQAADELVDQIQKAGGKVHASQVDVRDLESVKAWIDAIKSEYGQIDVLVNNAGIKKDKALMMMSQDDWRDVLATNLDGMFNVAKACIVNFMKQKSGVIVNVSSVSGVIGLPGQTNYSTTKGGMNAFTKALAKEVAPYQVRVNAVAPGFIQTDMLADYDEEKINELAQSIPAARIGTVEDVADSVVFLASDQASYITGQILHIDGGLAMR